MGVPDPNELATLLTMDHHQTIDPRGATKVNRTNRTLVPKDRKVNQTFDGYTHMSN
jgi:hypothetical protein